MAEDVDEDACTEEIERRSLPIYRYLERAVLRCSVGELSVRRGMNRKVHHIENDVMAILRQLRCDGGTSLAEVEGNDGVSRVSEVSGKRKRRLLSAIM